MQGHTRLRQALDAADREPQQPLGPTPRPRMSPQDLERECDRLFEMAQRAEAEANRLRQALRAQLAATQHLIH